MLGFSLFLLPRLGIEGVGVAWLVSQTVVATWLFVARLRPVLFDRAPSRPETDRSDLSRPTGAFSEAEIDRPLGQDENPDELIRSLLKYEQMLIRRKKVAEN